MSRAVSHVLTDPDRPGGRLAEAARAGRAASSPHSAYPLPTVRAADRGRLRARPRRPTAASAAGVVRRLDRHLHVVRVAFLQTSRGDAHKLAVSLNLINSAGTQVEHGLVQTTDQLVNHRG